MVKVYLANGLFSEADRMYNIYLAEKIAVCLSEEIELYVPQFNEAINDKNSFANSMDIALADVNELKNSDILVAVIDGNDNGVSNEIGIAYALGIPIIGLYTDVRQQGTGNQKKINALIEDSTENQFIYHNLMEIGLIKNNGVIVDNIDDLLIQLRKYI